MKNLPTLIAALIIVAIVSLPTFAQDLSPEQVAAAEKAFKTANDLLERSKYADALTIYKRLLTTIPNNTAVLYNAGMAAFFAKDYATALDMWQQVKKLEPADWQIRAKLIQTYQALKKLPERDAERAELFAMWKKGEPAELKQQFKYCREQFEVNGMRVMAWEHFELQGPRGLRYVFSILDKTGEAEDWRISLGSYDTTNNIWSELQNPRPKEGERLFHLDGYFKGGGHATYGMYPPPEPSYDQIREIVLKILEGKDKPVTSTTPAKPKP